MSKFKHSKFYTLSAAVYAVLEDLQAGEERFNQFLKWARDGYMRFNFDTSYEIHYQEIPMKPHKQIDWPDEMVDWEKIGFKCGDTVKVFTNDSSIPKTFDKIDCVPQENKEHPDLASLTSDELVPFWGADDFFSSGGNHFYGALLHYNYRGYFDVDAKNRVFNFKRVVNNVNTVYLEYITDGINYSGQTVIPPQAFKCIQDYIHWQRKEHDDRYSAGEAQRAKEIFEDEFDRVFIRNLKLSLEDIKEALRSAHKQTVKS